MEFSATDMYWLVKLDDIRGLLDGFGIPLLLILVVVGWMPFVALRDDGKILHFKKILAAVLFVFLLGSSMLIARAFIPSTKQMAAIFVLPKIINNKQLQEIPNKILDLSTDWLEELKPVKTKTE